MRIILRMLAAPLWGLLVLTVAVCSFVLSLAGVFLWILSGLVGVAGVVMLFTHQTAGGVAFLVIAFLLSPHGLPALMSWLVDKLDDARYSIKTFVAG